MKKIISIIQPFDATQKICVYDEDTQIVEKYSLTEDLPNELYHMAKTYNIDSVILKGSDYLANYVIKKIKEQETLNFDNKKISIIKI